LTIAITLTTLILMLQIVGGIYSGSLALLSDAGHVFVDLASLAIAFIGLKLAERARHQHNIRYTFGLRRIEILAALTNGFLLVGICIYIGIEAVKRLVDPSEVHAESMLIIAAIGFVANGISALYLHRSTHITTRSAYLHVLTDLMSSGGVIIGALILSYTDWMWVDPAISLAIAALILTGAFRVIKESGVILMESSPVHIDPAVVRTEISALSGVNGVHDVHIWQLGQNEFNASVHVVSDRNSDDMVVAVQSVLKDRFGIDHVTVQVETTDLDADCGAC
jgi:cobalt-zinc-cadmium efflux system protein